MTKYHGNETTESHRIRMKEYNNKLREKAYRVLGKFCWACNSTEKLCLHHNYYAVDSAKPGKGVGSKRYLEAVNHPERFMVLCKSCHAKHHQMEREEKYPQVLKILITKIHPKY